MQFFHWYNPADDSLWNELHDKIEGLAKLGVSALRLPPTYKGNSGGLDVGYAVYDMYDLGEFDQKGSVRTKYGTKEELVRAVDLHDTQPLLALESVVEPWFKPLAYALILLQRDGYPCIFYADYFGVE